MKCSDCEYFRSAEKVYVGADTHIVNARCVRYPTAVHKTAGDYCGEHKQVERKSKK